MSDVGLISLIVTVVGVAGALLIWRAALWAHANFLFERPDAFLDRAEEGGLRAAGGGIAAAFAARIQRG